MWYSEGMTNQREQLQALQAALGGNTSAEHADRLLSVFGADAFRVVRQDALELAAERRARAVLATSLVPVSADMFDREMDRQMKAAQ